MRPSLLAGALVIVGLGLCGFAAAEMVVYDHFDSAEVDTGLWNVDAGSAVSQSGSILTLGSGSSNPGWSGMTSTNTFDASAPNTYEFKFINAVSSNGANPYFGLYNVSDPGGNTNVFVRKNGGWGFYVNGAKVSDINAPVSQHPFDFVRTANTWQVWDMWGGGTWVPTLAAESAPGNVGFAPGDRASLWMAIRPSAGAEQLSLGYIAVDAVTTPEPAMFVLMGSALLGLLAYAWRKRK
jgi:hypothetical protein